MHKIMNEIAIQVMKIEQLLS